MEHGASKPGIVQIFSKTLSGRRSASFSSWALAPGFCAKGITGPVDGMTLYPELRPMIEGNERRENASDRLFFHRRVSCPRRFRSRLATIRELLRSGSTEHIDRGFLVVIWIVVFPIRQR